ncbi:MAG: YerC/YecD family TrpR-related protein [Bacteroidota bacterium]
MKRASTRDIDRLYAAVLRLRNLDECRCFLRDLLTETEIHEFAQRWKAAQMLEARLPYKTIERETGLSSRTIARVQKWIKNGRGGYRLMLRRMRSASPNGAGSG